MMEVKQRHTTNMQILQITIVESRPEERDVMVNVSKSERRANLFAFPSRSNVSEAKVVVNLINKNNQ